MTFYQSRNLIVKGQTSERGNLWLGDYESARNKKNLKIDNIYHVITAGLGMKISYNSDFKHKMLPLYDHESENITRYFESSFAFIDEHLESGNVLIHCFAGVSRSATILAAYLMRKKGWNSRQTLLFIKKARPYIGPNRGFVKQLKRFEEQMKNGFEQVMTPKRKVEEYESKNKSQKIKKGNEGERYQNKDLIKRQNLLAPRNRSVILENTRKDTNRRVTLNKFHA